MMLGQNFQSDGHETFFPENSLGLQLLNDNGKKIGEFSVVVKTLTTTGVILDIRDVENDVGNEIQKGKNVFFKVYAEDKEGSVELPGKILWRRDHGSDTALTLGLELSEPLPLSIRHTLEDSMSIGAKDMKVLWDYWDETKETEVPAHLLEPTSIDPIIPLTSEVPEGPEISRGRNGHGIYWLGIGTILTGLALQLPQLEYLSLSGLVMMFGGSLMIAWKSIMSMCRIPSSEPMD